MNEVVSFYDEHPINEGEILAKLGKANKDTEHLTPEDLFPYDQDDYGDLEASDALAVLLGLDETCRVLDICSGLGGTSSLPGLALRLRGPPWRDLLIYCIASATYRNQCSETSAMPFRSGPERACYHV